MYITIDYPVEATFEVRKNLQTDKEKTEYLRKWLKKNKINSPCHDYSDYHVEKVISYSKFKLNSEYWIVGS